MLRARAPAKVNLTLHVLGRRADGFHALDSLVAFAGCAADALTLAPATDLSLDVEGPFARAAGEGGDNLVLKAACEAAARIPGLTLGRFGLVKRIPVAAGLGGGSADAAAALRLIAQANGLFPSDPRLVEAAAATGSDVPACLLSRAARMTGRGEGVEPLDGFQPLAAVLMNPLKAVPTAEIFGRLGLEPGQAMVEALPLEPSRGGRPHLKPGATLNLSPPGRGRSEGPGEGVSPSPDMTEPPHPPSLRDVDLSPLGRGGSWRPSPYATNLTQVGGDAMAAPSAVARGRNDLEPPARALLPEIGEGIAALAASEGCRLARMSGSGATVFGLYDDARAARLAARALRLRLPGWWVLPTLLR